MFLTRSRMAAMAVTPSSSSLLVRNTPACDCIAARRSLATFCAYSPPVLDSRRARRASVLSAASLGSGLCDVPAALKALCASTMWLPAARPNTTRSSSELVPRRLAPCTDTQAHSPTAYRPLTTLLGSSPLGTTTWPWMLVGMPPIW